MNTLQQPNKEGILLSVSDIGAGTLARITRLVSEILNPDRNDGDLEPIGKVFLHIPAVLFAADPAPERRRSVASLLDFITDGRLSVWSAGYAGAPLDLLTSAEQRFEREWASKNRWKHGIADVIGTPGVRYFPTRVRTDQARHLTASGAPLCVGYPWGDSDRVIANLTLWDPVGWYTLQSRIVHVGAEGDPIATPIRERNAPADILHVILPAEGIVDSAVNPLAGMVRTIHAGIGHHSGGGGGTVRPALDDSVPVYGSAVPAYQTSREPVILALLSHADRSGSDELASRPTVCAAADRVVDGRRIVPAQSSKRSDETPQEQRDDRERDLQGGSTGGLSMEDGSLRVRFLGGRIAGFDPDSTATRPDERIYRAQGVARYVSDAHRSGTGETDRYLQTDLSAWFTRLRTRGIREIASVTEAFTVESESIMIEDTPGLLFGQTFTVPETPPAGLLWAVPFEIALHTISDETGIPIIVRQGGGYLSSSVENWFPGEERTIYAGSVTLSLPNGTLRIAGVVPSRGASVPFRFAVVPKEGVPTLVFRTSSTLQPESWPAKRRWSVSYLFTSSAESKDNIEETARSIDVLQELPGFTAETPR